MLWQELQSGTQFITSLTRFRVLYPEVSERSAALGIVVAMQAEEQVTGA